jgi:hypothetical protein
MDDPLVRNAETLVSAAQIQAVGSYDPLCRRYAILRDVEHDQWDFIVTIAGVFMGIRRLGELRLEPARERALVARVTQRLTKWAPDDGVVALEDCKRLFQHEYERLARRGHDVQFVVSDAIGIWATWHIFGHEPTAEAEAALARDLGAAVTLAFYHWWREHDPDDPLI